MKKLVITTALAGVVGFCPLNGTLFETHAPKISKVEVVQPLKRDRFFLGPDIFWAKESPQIKEISMKSDSVYYGLKGGYDFLRPGAIYAGAHASYAIGRMHIKAESEKMEFYDDRTNGTFANGELRVGYNIPGSQPFFLTPFVGVGGYHVRPMQSIDYTQNWVYGAVGFLADLEVSSNCNVGLNVKGTRALYLEQRVKKSTYSGSYRNNANALGFEVSLPVTLKLGASQSWDLQLEPYYLMLNSHSRASVVGGQMNLSLKY
jgi:hypothetical protein